MRLSTVLLVVSCVFFVTVASAVPERKSSGRNARLTSPSIDDDQEDRRPNVRPRFIAAPRRRSRVNRQKGRLAETEGTRGRSVEVQESTVVMMSTQAHSELPEVDGVTEKLEVSVPPPAVEKEAATEQSAVTTSVPVVAEGEEEEAVDVETLEGAEGSAEEPIITAEEVAAPEPEVAAAVGQGASVETVVSTVPPRVTSKPQSSGNGFGSPIQFGSRGGGGGGFFFPGEGSFTRTDLDDTGVALDVAAVSSPSCQGQALAVFDNTTQRCRFLLEEDECDAEGEWFVLDQETGEPVCRPRPCPSGQVLLRGACVPWNQTDACPAGMKILLDNYGRAFCDCDAAHLYWPRDRRCYPAYRQGPCYLGQYLVLSQRDQRPHCRRNPCFRDGSVFWNETEDARPGCFQLLDKEETPCPPGILAVSPISLQLECDPLGTRAIFDPPPVRCGSGSELDYSGKCRQELKQAFRSGFFVPREPEEAAVCPKGYVQTANGRCEPEAAIGLALG